MSIDKLLLLLLLLLLFILCIFNILVLYFYYYDSFVTATWVVKPARYQIPTALSLM
jgi:hypothetical protein